MHMISGSGHNSNMPFQSKVSTTSWQKDCDSLWSNIHLQTINNWSSPRSKVKASGWLQSAVTTTHVLSMRRCYVAYVIIFIVECGIAMCVFDFRASSSSHRLPLCQSSFFCGFHCWASPWREIAYPFTHSLIQLIWCLETKAFVVCFRIIVTSEYDVWNMAYSDPM